MKSVYLENMTFLIADFESQYTITCNQSKFSQQVTWIQTINKTNTYLVQNDSRITFSGTNGQQLNFATLSLVDDEYYSCGYLTGSTYQLLSSYLLFIRGNTHVINALK